MDDKHMTRLYTEREVGALIQRASEIQERASDEPERGLSLLELEQIAAEVGIAPEHLRAAAVDLTRDAKGGAAVRFWGGPFSLSEKRVIEATITEDQWPAIVEGLRDITGSEGRAHKVGRSLEWKREYRDIDFLVEQTAVTVRPGHGRSNIEVRKRYRGGAVLAYGLGAILGGGIAGIFLDGAGLSDLVTGLVAASGSIGGLGAARTAVGYWTRRQRAELSRISDWLHKSLMQPDSAHEPAEIAGPTASGGVLEGEPT